MKCFASCQGLPRPAHSDPSGRLLQVPGKGKGLEGGVPPGLLKKCGKERGEKGGDGKGKDKGKGGKDGGS